MITRTQLSLAVALSLTVTSTWAATETTVCEVWRITDGTPLVTSDGRPVLTNQCKVVQIVTTAEAPVPTTTVTETAASTEAVVEPPSEPVEEASAQTVEPTAPTAEPEAATQASVEPVAEPVVEPVVEPVAVAEPVAEPVAEEAVAEAEAAPEPEPAVVKYRFKSYQTTVLFDFDKSNLDADDRGSLQQLAMASNKGDIVRVHLTGHADSRGTHAYNMSLSERRIQAVISFLAELNIMATSLFAKGETDPVLVDGKEDFDLSRRVQIDLKTRSK